jgi:hypothetical protein
MRKVDEAAPDQLRAGDGADFTERPLSQIAPHAPLLRCDQQYAFEPEEIAFQVMDYGREIRRVTTRVTIAVPFEGDRDLFTCQPSSYTSSFPHALLADSELHFVYDLQPASPEDTRHAVDRDVEHVEQYLRWVRADVEAFVPELRSAIRDAVNRRRSRLSTAAAAITALGVPVRARGAATPGPMTTAVSLPSTSYDAFLSYAAEDSNFAEGLAAALVEAGFRIWFAPLQLTVGDSLNREINRGLRDARYGIVVLSVPFFSKPWPQYELGGLLAREMAGQKVILPVWRNITKEHVLAHQPALADRFALASPLMELSAVVAALARALRSS